MTQSPPATEPVTQAIAPPKRSVWQVAGRAGYEFLHRVILAPVHEGRLRDIDWPLGLRPLVVVGLVGYVVAALLVLFSGPLREWIPLAAQAGAFQLTLPRSLVWLVLALTALSTTLAATGALHTRAWLRWVMTVFVISIMLFIAVPDQELIPVARIITIAACIGLIVYVAVRGGRGYRWWDFVAIAALVWGPLIVTASVLTSVNREAGFDFMPLMLSLTLSTLGQLAVPAALASGAAVASVTVSSALWAAKIVRSVIGPVAVFIVLGLVAAWRTFDVAVGAGDLVADAESLRALGVAALLLALIAASWVALRVVRRDRGGATAQAMADRIDGLALIVAAFTTTSVVATPVLVLGQVSLGYGAPKEVASFFVAAAGWATTSTVMFIVRAVGAIVLIVLAFVQARRGRRTTPELMAAVGVAGLLIAVGVLFELPLGWNEDALAILGAVLGLAVLVGSLVARRLTPARATSVLIALLMSALFAYREFVTDPIAYLLGFAGGAVVLFGFVWSFLTGYKAANEDSPAYPRPSRVQLVLANAIFGITVLAFLALARDPDASVSLGELAEYGAQAYGDPLVAAGLLLALWAALRGRELDDVPEEDSSATV
ncbi:hypothetical protein H4J02_01055 [Protaetiibacter sp. SSC-01]|uniref:hypothetical protein n=1 Tax=Protaetiibacter sp. SSC-01 TaxID=2759943 RepID=UPI0016570FFE|nr:hypothetical protein [Protaetiibacter sp. SSC-01]QNO37666.1 hypothetical protein H4J02_01055 [Protaetiibacter sp. SSC-01]